MTKCNNLMEEIKITNWKNKINKIEIEFENIDYEYQRILPLNKPVQNFTLHDFMSITGHHERKRENVKVNSETKTVTLFEFLEK